MILSKFHIPAQRSLSVKQNPKKSRFFKIFSGLSLITLITCTLLAFTPFQPPTTANTTSTPSTTSPLGLNPETDETILVTEKGIEIKQHKATSGGAPTAVNYFTMGSYSGTPLNWIILQHSANGLAENSTPAGTAVNGDTTKQIVMGGVSSSLLVKEMLVISQYCFGSTTQYIEVANGTRNYNDAGTGYNSYDGLPSSSQKISCGYKNWGLAYSYVQDGTAASRLNIHTAQTEKLQAYLNSLFSSTTFSTLEKTYIKTNTAVGNNTNIFFAPTVEQSECLANKVAYSLGTSTARNWWTRDAVTSFTPTSNYSWNSDGGYNSYAMNQVALNKYYGAFCYNTSGIKTQANYATLAMSYSGGATYNGVSYYGYNQTVTNTGTVNYVRPCMVVDIGCF